MKQEASRTFVKRQKESRKATISLRENREKSSPKDCSGTLYGILNQRGSLSNLHSSTKAKESHFR